MPETVSGMIAPPMSMAAFLNLRARARELGALKSDWHLSASTARQLRQLLLEAQGGICAICGQPIKGLNYPDCTIDHVRPKSAGHADAPGNLLVAHQPCNLEKANIPPSPGLLDALEFVNQLLGWKRRAAAEQVERVDYAALEEKVFDHLHIGPRGPYQMDVLRWRLVKELPQLAEKYPDGVGSQQIAEHYGINKATVVLALQELRKNGKIQWRRVPGSHAYIAPPLGGEVPATPLSNRQRSVMDALLREWQLGDEMSLSLDAIARKVHSNTNTTGYVIGVLVSRGYLKVVKRGIGGHPSTYRIMRLTPAQKSWEIASVAVSKAAAE